MSDDFVSRNCSSKINEIKNLQENDKEYNDFLNYFDEIFNEEKNKVKK